MIKKIPIEVSGRHIHLSQRDLEKLFGKGYRLKKLKKLTQPNDFAAKETLTIQNGLKKIFDVRIVGPVRKETQVELSITDAIEIGIKPVLRISGDLKASPGIILIGPRNRKIKIKQGVIIPLRHIHISPKRAELFKFKNGQIVSIKVKGRRKLVFNNVNIRISKDYKLCMHIDTDEGNAAEINKKAKGFLIL